MSQYDFQNFLQNSNDADIYQMTEICFTGEHLKQLILSNPEKNLNKIRKDFDLPDDYEIAELIHRLDGFELSDLIKDQLSRDILIAELCGINNETKQGLINHYMNKETQNIILKLKDLERVIETNPSIYSRILTFNEQIELCNEALLQSSNNSEIVEHRIALKNEIEALAFTAISEEFGPLLKVCINAKPYYRLPDKINIHNVFKNTVIFDFPVKSDFQDVIFNGYKLKEGNHFCVIWLGDFMGFDDSERFITLFHYNIDSMSPLIGEMYVYDSTWNDHKVCGVLFIQGEEVLESKYSTVEVISEEYFRAYRINPNNEKDENDKVIPEGWQYYNKHGKRINDFEEI